MTWLMEERQSAITVAIIGVITAVILATGWVKTGRQEVLYALVAAVLLAALVLGVQRLVVTEAEKVEKTLAQIAHDVERNDVKALVEHVDSRAPQIRAQVESEFPKYRFTKVEITRIREITVDMKHVPPQAIAQFSVVVSGTDAEGLLDGQTVPRFVIVRFHKENGRWRVYHYEHYEPQRAIMESPATFP